MAAPGFFFTGEDSLTPDAVDRKRILLNALRKDNLSTAPVQHWTQAAARVMGSLGDTLEERQLNRTEKQGVDENKAALLAAFGLGGAASPPAPSAGAALPASQPAPATPPQMAQDGTPVPPQKPASLGGNPEPTQMAGLPSMAQQPGPAALIRSFEGYRPTPYWDVNALRTGYGSDTITKPDGSVTRVAQGMQINRDDAERDLQRRISTEFMPKAASAVGAERWAALPPNAQAALTSVTYNYGSLPKSVAAAAQTGDVNAIAQAVEGLAGHNGGVNAGRRQKEAAIIRGGADIPAGGSAQAQFNVPGAPAQSGSTPQTAALLQALSSPWAARNPMLAQLGQKVLGEQLTGNKLTYQTLADGTIIALDPTGRRPPTEVYKAPVKPILRGQDQELVDPNTGRVIGGDTKPATVRLPDGREVEVPKDPEQRKKFLQELGTESAKAVQGAPDAVNKMTLGIKTIDQLIGSPDGKMKEHPGYNQMFGMQRYLPAAPGGSWFDSGRADAEAIVEQLKSQAFLTSVKEMQGMGALSNAEGAKIESAVARLSTKQSPTAFKEGLKEIRSTFEQSRARMQTIANNGKPPAGAAPQSGPVSVGGWKIEKVD